MTFNEDDDDEDTWDPPNSPPPPPPTMHTDNSADFTAVATANSSASTTRSNSLEPIAPPPPPLPANALPVLPPLDSEEEDDDDDDDDDDSDDSHARPHVQFDGEEYDDENSTILHSENQHGDHRMSFSQTDFANPPPPTESYDDRTDAQLAALTKRMQQYAVDSPPTSPTAAATARPPPPVVTNAHTPTSTDAPRRGPPPVPLSALSPRSQPPPIPPSYSPAAASASSTALSPSASPTASSNGGDASSGGGSTMDEVTIDYYLRQAFAVSDYDAMKDLVKKASAARIETDLVSQARSMLVDRATEERENEITTLKHYMKQSLQSRRADPIRDVLRKVEPVAAAISAGPHRRMHADFFALLTESQTALAELEKEDAQTVSAYLRQGVAQRSREVLQAALAKSASIKHALLDEAALTQAKAILSELDAAVLLRNYLQLAMKNRDLAALDETIAQAHRVGLTEKDTPELADARKVAEELRAHSGGKQRKAEKERLKQAEKEQKERERQLEKAAAVHEKIRERSKWFGSGSKEKEKKPAKPLLFGGPLTDAIKLNAPKSVPKVCEDCMTFLRTHADEPGLFRVAGNKELIDVLRAQYEENFAVTDGHSTAPKLTEVHDASGLFKLYFRLLPEPLIPYQFYDRFVKVGMNKGPDRIQQLHDLIAQLPKDNIGQGNTGQKRDGAAGRSPTACGPQRY